MSVAASTSSVGVVIIGRNEGERLRRCLESVLRETGGSAAGARIVYVDSGSSDGSVALAREMGAEVVELDMSVPFSAARARNAGFERLMSEGGVEFVQFVDGDCELIVGWMDEAAAALRADPKVAAVCGRLRERHPEASVYNRLCDIEFTRAPGVVNACGGIFMGRASALAEVGGFNPSVVAGEEPEMCLRLRRRGYTIVRLGRDMAWHDSAMMRFGQWWKRAVRSGHAYAQGMALHGRGPERYCVRESRGIWLWGLGLPALALALAWPTWGLSVLLLGLYPMQAVRTALGRKEPDERPGDRWLYGIACTVMKFPQWVGQVKFYWNAARGRAPRIIEHKSVPAPAAGTEPATAAAGGEHG